MMRYTSNWLGEPIVVGCQLDPDEDLERLRDEIAIQDALEAAYDKYIDDKIDERRIDGKQAAHDE